MEGSRYFMFIFPVVQDNVHSNSATLYIVGIADLTLILKML